MTREHRVGVVRAIGAGTRFVLIEVPAAGASTLPDGQMLRCASSTAADAPTTASLRVARERRPPFVVADVLSGEPRVGDTAYLIPGTTPAQIAPLVLPTSTSSVLPITLPGATPGTTRP